MSISTARMITGPGTCDMRLLSSINASSLVIPCSFLSLPGRAPTFGPAQPVPLLSYIMSSPSTPPDMAPVTITNCHDTALNRDL